jgi:hypothetical protein
MKRFTRSTLAVAMAAAALGVTAAPALAKTKHFTIGGAAKVVGGAKLVGVTCKGTLGKCSVKGTLAPPDEYIVWTVAGGTIKATAVSQTGLANVSHGTFTITGGTGKYAGATGKGTYAGLLSTGDFTYRGTLKF